jgi:hypothetical protein
VQKGLDSQVDSTRTVAGISSAGVTTCSVQPMRQGPSARADATQTHGAMHEAAVTAGCVDLR